MKTLLALVIACAPMFAADTAQPGLFRSPVHFPVAALPSGSTVVFTQAVDVTLIALVNTNASTQVTVTISCTGGAVFEQALLNGVSTQNNHFDRAFAGGLSCPNGVTVVTTGTGVNAYLKGNE